jgi:hypothetical protein
VSLPTFTFNDFRKNPFPAILLIVFMVVGYLFKSLTNVSDRMYQDCMIEKAAMKIEIAKKDSLIYSLTMQKVLTESVLRDMPRTIDSVVRTPTQEKVNSLLKK